MTWPADGVPGNYLVQGYAVKTASGTCPDIPMPTGVWHATVADEGACPSFVSAFTTHTLSSPWCDYTFTAYPGDIPPDASIPIGLCTADTVLIEPIVWEGSPWGSGCSGCTGTVDVPTAPMPPVLGTIGH
jgi:hypothetical protein